MIWLQLAWRDLCRNTRRSLFAVFTVAVGTLATVVAAGYVVATLVAVRESAIHGGVGHLQIATAAEFGGYEETILRNGLAPDQAQRILARVNATEHVTLIAPRLAFQGIASTGERSVAMLGEGIEPELERRLSAHYGALVTAGRHRLESKPGMHTALVGREMARLLGVEPGEWMTLLATSAAGGLNAVDVEIVGLIATGTPAIDRMRVLVSLRTAQALLQTAKIRRLVVALDDTRNAVRVRDELGEALQSVAIRTWRELAPFHGQLAALFLRQSAVLCAVIALIVLIAVFSAVALGILERSREIGTLLSLGIPARKIRRTFIYEGLLMGLAGGLGGADLGLLACHSITALRLTMPAPPGQTEPYPLILTFEPRVALLTVIAMALLAMIAAWLASKRVSERTVAEAMSHA